MPRRERLGHTTHDRDAGPPRPTRHSLTTCLQRSNEEEVAEVDAARTVGEVRVVVVVVVHRLADELGQRSGEVHGDREEDVRRHELVRSQCYIRLGLG